MRCARLRCIGLRRGLRGCPLTRCVCLTKAYLAITFGMLFAQEKHMKNAQEELKRSPAHEKRMKNTSDVYEKESRT